MQLVRVLTGQFERTWRRKFAEMALALLVTRYTSRAELPALYLSVAHYGWRMNGFAQACHRLNIEPAKPSLSDAALLVARLKYPQPRHFSARRWRQLVRRAEYLIARYEDR